MDNLVAQSAVENKLSESNILDFKRDPYTDNKDWLKDVTAFANTSGGRIIMGVDEDESGFATEAIGLKIDNLDKEIHKLFSWLREHSEPDVSGSVRIWSEQDNHGRLFLIADIEESSLGPHRLKVQSSKANRHVYLRKGRDCVPATMSEIGELFEGSTRTMSKIFEFVRQRREAIPERSAMGYGIFQYMCIHVCPRQGFGSRRLVDVALSVDTKTFAPENANWSQVLPNPLGAIVQSAERDDKSYHQLFYNGCAELLYARIKGKVGEQGDSDHRSVIPGAWLKKYIRENTTQIIRFMRSADSGSQFSVDITFSGVHQTPLYWRAGSWPEGSRSSPLSDVIEIPSVLVRTQDDGSCFDVDIDNLMQLIWRAWGEKECPL